ncbi:hypothetical protein, partial [Xanthomonas oryzae]
GRLSLAATVLKDRANQDASYLNSRAGSVRLTVPLVEVIFTDNVISDRECLPFHQSTARRSASTGVSILAWQRRRGSLAAVRLRGRIVALRVHRASWCN